VILAARETYPRGMHSVETPHAPRPAGHYAQAVVHGGLVFVAGQLPVDPADPSASPRGVEEQTERALRNVEAILAACGSGLDRLLSVTVYVADIALWPRVNATYARVLGPHRPARAVVPVPALHHGYLVEVQAIAALPD
jgi:2-iminobutanoate/2-iminopropanoate deaminase